MKIFQNYLKIEKTFFFVLNCNIHVINRSSYLDFDNHDWWTINRIEENLSWVPKVLWQIIILKSKINKLVIWKKQYFPEI